MDADQQSQMSKEDLRQLADLRAGNDTIQARLRQRGVATDFIGLRVETLIDMLIEPDERPIFELEFESRRARLLAQVEQQVTRAMLTQGLAPRSN